MLQKGKKALDRAKEKIDAEATRRFKAEQQLKVVHAENQALIKQRFTCKIENVRRLEIELERVLGENNTLQNTIDQLRKTKGKFKMSDFDDNTGHGYELINAKMLENENAKLKKELQALSNLKATNMLKSIRDSHNLESKCSNLEKECSELKNKNVHLKLKLERIVNGSSVRNTSPNSSVSPDNSCGERGSPMVVSPVRLKSTRPKSTKVTKIDKENNKVFSAGIASRGGASRILTKSTLKLSGSKRNSRIKKKIQDLSSKNSPKIAHDALSFIETKARKDPEEETANDECITQ